MGITIDPKALRARVIEKTKDTLVDFGLAKRITDGDDDDDGGGSLGDEEDDWAQFDREDDSGNWEDTDTYGSMLTLMYVCLWTALKLRSRRKNKTKKPPTYFPAALASLASQARHQPGEQQARGRADGRKPVGQDRRRVDRGAGVAKGGAGKGTRAKPTARAPDERPG